MRQLLACAAVALVLPGCGIFYPPGNADSGGAAKPPMRCAACPGDVAPGGAPGRDGTAGPPGRDGVRGERGLRGERGEQGPAGQAGATGATGAGGSKGPEGRDGKDGAEGQRGPAGRDGKDGRDGRDGIDGRDGKEGPAGPPGPRGAAGSPGASDEEGLAKQLDRLLGRKDAACDCRPGVTAGPDAGAGKPWWERLFNLFLAFLGGMGAFITACTPLLLGLLKIHAEQQKEASRSPASGKAAISDPPVLWIAGIVVLGGLFFTFLLYSFAVAVLIFICAFMLCSSVLIVALGHAYKTIDGAMLAREKQDWDRNRTLELDKREQARRSERDKRRLERLERERQARQADSAGGSGNSSNEG